MTSLILASTSPYRRELLLRLGLPFSVESPDVDETPLSDETPAQCALRLAEAKARAVAARHPNALIIGSDQVAHCANQRLGKPGTREIATAQLSALSGQTAQFDTAVCLLDSAAQNARTALVSTRATFRLLSDTEIQRYLDKEYALDCAGSARSEGLGISLLERLQGDDPTALVGLPLIALCKLLRAAGLDVP